MSNKLQEIHHLLCWTGVNLLIMWVNLIHYKCRHFAKQGFSKIRGADQQQLLFKVEVIDLMSVVRMKALFSSNLVYPKSCNGQEIFFNTCRSSIHIVCLYRIPEEECNSMLLYISSQCSCSFRWQFFIHGTVLS